MCDFRRPESQGYRVRAQSYDYAVEVGFTSAVATTSYRYSTTARSSYQLTTQAVGIDIATLLVLTWRSRALYARLVVDPANQDEKMQPLVLFGRWWGLVLRIKQGVRVLTR